MTGAPYFEVGYVARAHGLSGEVAVRTFDPTSEVLFEVGSVQLKHRDGTVERAKIRSCRRGASRAALLTLEGVTDRSCAERLIGTRVLVARKDLEKPAKGEFFQGDLIGLAAYDLAGTRLGQVAEVIACGPVANLVIREGRAELWVPFADEFVREVDLAAGRLVVRPPEYLE